MISPPPCVQRNNIYDYTSLLGFGKADRVIAQIVNRVPSSQESITQDSKGPYRLREVYSHDGADATTLNLKNIVKGTNGKIVAGEGESKIWKRVTFRAINSILSVPSFLGANLLIQKLGQRGRESNTIPN